jgi:hypothetical protein
MAFQASTNVAAIVKVLFAVAVVSGFAREASAARTFGNWQGLGTTRPGLQFVQRPADFNGDGHLDVAAYDPLTGDIWSGSGRRVRSDSASGAPWSGGLRTRSSPVAAIRSGLVEQSPASGVTGSCNSDPPDVVHDVLEQDTTPATVQILAEGEDFGAHMTFYRVRRAGVDKGFVFSVGSIRFGQSLLRDALLPGGFGPLALVVRNALQMQ